MYDADADYGEYIWSAAQMVECQLQAVQRRDYDWILLLPDDYIEFEPLGVETTVKKRIPPAAVANPPATRETLNGLRVPDADTDWLARRQHRPTKGQESFSITVAVRLTADE